jgi:anti-sigma factor RsiW
MTCGEARELFSTLVDEALTPDERAALDRHLAGCAECRAELQRFRSVVSSVHAIEPDRAPVGFVDRVRARTHPAPWYRRLARFLVFPLPVKLPLGAAAAVLLAVLVSLLYRQSPELEQAARRGPVPAPTAEAPAVGHAPAPPASAQAPAPPAAREDTARSRDAVLSKQAAPESREPGRAGELNPPPARAKTEAQRQAPEPAAPEGEATVGITAGKKEAAAHEPDLAGRLTVADLAGAENALDSLVSRSGGRETGRRPIPDGFEVEVAIPRAHADGFMLELSRIGRWQAARAAESPGDPVRVRIQLVR